MHGSSSARTISSVVGMAASPLMTLEYRDIETIAHRVVGLSEPPRKLLIAADVAQLLVVDLAWSATLEETRIFLDLLVQADKSAAEEVA
jgi:hypothetical protein